MGQPQQLLTAALWNIRQGPTDKRTAAATQERHQHGETIEGRGSTSS